MEDVLIIVNPASRGGKTGRHWPAVAAELREAGLRFEAVQTTRPGEATELARAAVAESRPVVAAVGGDGTVNEIVNGFFEGDEPIATSTALGLVPHGTGGDFRRTFGLYGDAVAVADWLGGDSRRRIDAGRVELRAPDGSIQVRHFLNIAAAGLPAEVSRNVSRGLRLFNGALTFGLASVQAGLSWKNKPMRIVTDGEVSEVVAQQVAVANCRYYGGGMMIAPHAVPDDGLFDVVIVGDIGILEGPKLLAQLRTGSHLGNPKIFRRLARKVEVSSPHQIAVDVDGELPGLLPAVFEVVPGAIEVAVPSVPAGNALPAGNV